MSKPFTVKVLEQCKVSPPPNTTPKTCLLPLTFLDLPWLFFSPSQPLFFYEFPCSISHFTTSTIPRLKHSLSLTLQHYYPFAGKFVPSLDTKPHLAFAANDNSSISLTFAIANGADFEHLCSNHPRDVRYFHPLVPKLASIPSLGEKGVPLISIQVTLFPNFGISIGLSFHHVLADGRTFSNFFKAWASYCSSSESTSPFFLPEELLPFHDRSVIVDDKGLEEVFLKEWRRRTLENGITIGRTRNPKLLLDLSSSGIVRATFLIGVAEMEKIKRFIVDYCKEKNHSQPVHLSAYVLTCAFLWVCLAKTQQIHMIDDENLGHEDHPTYFGFIAGGITRFDFSVPKTYLGNCVGFGIATLKRRELLLEENGIVVAAKAIGSTIKNLDASIFDEAKNWVLDWEVLLNGSQQQQHLHATWSPKLKLYDESNFGWGRPKKIEEISIDSTRAISLIQSRDFVGGIEIGLALNKNHMDDFTIFFNQGLNDLP